MDTASILVPILIVGSCLLLYFRERRIVKQGHCGFPWQSFDMDSQGGVGIKCQKCHISTWVSWYTKGICHRKWT